MDVILQDLGFVCALGTTHDEIIRNAKQGDTSGMFRVMPQIANTPVPFGAVPIQTKQHIRCYDLLLAALEQLTPAISALKSNYSPDRIGIVLGASNTGIHEAQHHINTAIQTGKLPSDFSLTEIELYSPTVFLRQKAGVSGPAYTVSTACSSSAKVFQDAHDLIAQDICDAVLVGGVDARCDFALNGFNALSALSFKHTNPMSQNRDGINLGEGAAIFIMTRGGDGIKLLGVGESSDAYHLTSPDPTGAGAISSMQMALKKANITPKDIDFINMHGTGTIANDAMESLAINSVFGEETLCASTKTLTGHTLGAAGAISAALSWLMIKHQFIIPHIFDGEYATDCARINLATTKESKKVNTVLCNAFAFGGSNASIIIGQ
ncbi:MAG: beta-ketoacyl-ACP synthase [Alphaproteobacteria bacterium]|nr:beta-ketoacyl-ACP synthase [Alphaproteobacteria bacterium]